MLEIITISGYSICEDHNVFNSIFPYHWNIFESIIFVNTSDAFESAISFLSFIFLEFILVIGTFSHSDELSDFEPELLSEQSVPEPISSLKIVVNFGVNMAN